MDDFSQRQAIAPRKKRLDAKDFQVADFEETDTKFAIGLEGQLPDRRRLCLHR